MFILSKYCGARFELLQPAELDVNLHKDHHRHHHHHHRHRQQQNWM